MGREGRPAAIQMPEMPPTIHLEREEKLSPSAENLVQKMGVGPEDAERDRSTQKMFSQHRPEAI